MQDLQKVLNSHKILTSKQKAMIRVNQAGEHGATRIYAGQMAVLKNKEDLDILRTMADQEQDHLEKFNRLIIEHQVRPTLLQPVWHIAGYALGVATALLGREAAYACTIAVEEVIDEHYQDQLNSLEIEAPSGDLIDTIRTCREDEIHHKDIAIEQGGREANGYALLTTTIKSASRLAIWLSKRL
jgi:ubiquinone biosynthesis monooxygenase Coq7